MISSQTQFMNSFHLNIEQTVVKGYHSNQTHMSHFISIINEHIVAKRYHKIKLLRQPKCLTLHNKNFAQLLSIPTRWISFAYACE